MAEFGRDEALALLVNRGIPAGRLDGPHEDRIIAAIIEAHAAGRKQMREEAALACDSEPNRARLPMDYSHETGCEDCAAAIRALPD